MKSRILITGAGGLIGSGIASYLKQSINGVEITGVTSREEIGSVFDKQIKVMLGQPLQIAKNHFDTIIHCAFDKNDKSNVTNTTGTIQWAEDAKKAGIKKQIFLSSISSQSEFLNDYGKSKKDIETWFLARGHFVLRLGLVIANGGMFGRLVTTVKKSRFTPLIGGGKYLVFPTDPETIFHFITRIIKGDKRILAKKDYNLQFRDGISLKNLILKLSKKIGKKNLFISIPYPIIYSILAVAGTFKFLKLDIDTGNLKGMKWNSRMKLSSDLNTLGYKERPISEMLNKIDF